MNEQERRQGGQSIILVAVALVALVIFVAISVDLSDAYQHRRIAQNAADAAALAGAQELGRQLNGKTGSDSAVKAAMNDFAERNSIPDTDAYLGNSTNDNVEGWYLDRSKRRIRLVGSVTQPPNNAYGIEAVAYITAPTFFGGIVGAKGYPVQAEAAVVYSVACSGASCMLPIAIHEGGFLSGTQVIGPTFVEGECYNMWDGGGNGNFGWVNWSLQSRKIDDEVDYTYSCKDPVLYELGYVGTLPDDCSEGCLEINLDPAYCSRVKPEDIKIGDAVGGMPGVNNAFTVTEYLKEFITTPIEARILVYKDTIGKFNPAQDGGCGKLTNKQGLKYVVSGFACFRMTGFRLSHGQGWKTCDLLSDGVTLDCQLEGGEDFFADPYDPAECLDYPGVCVDADGNPCTWETGDFNRITGIFQTCLGGGEGHCKAVGNLLAPMLFK